MQEFYRNQFNFTEKTQKQEFFPAFQTNPYIRTKLESETMNPLPAADLLHLQQTSLMVGAPSHRSIRSLGWETISTQVSMLGLSMACKGFSECFDRFHGPSFSSLGFFGKKETTTTLSVSSKGIPLLCHQLYGSHPPRGLPITGLRLVTLRFPTNLVKINKVQPARILHW